MDIKIVILKYIITIIDVITIIVSVMDISRLDRFRRVILATRIDMGNPRRYSRVACIVIKQ